MSEAAWRALERTALAMGAREGTTPEHNPLTRSLSARAQAHGDREGHARGLREGHAYERMDLVAAALRARGIETALDFTEDRELFSGLSGDALMAAALACTAEADFRRADPGSSAACTPSFSGEADLSGVWSADFGCGDAKLPAGGRTRLPDDDVDIAAERGQEAEQALDRILAKVAAKEPRDVGLGQAEDARGLGLGDATLPDDACR